MARDHALTDVTCWRVDPSNDAEFDAWFAVLQRSETARDDRPGRGWHPDEWRARAVDLDAPVVHHLYALGVDPLRPVAVGVLEVTRLDNLHMIEASLSVDPDERRRGYGCTLLGFLEDTARDLGRRTLVVFVIEGRDEVGRGPNRGFAEARGYTVAEENVRRDLAWPRPNGELDGLDQSWRDHARDYEILSWTGPVSDDLVDARARLSAIMPVEAPHSNLEVEEEDWNATRVRHHEEQTNAMGRDLLVSAARHRASGELVGFSELTVSRDQPGTAYQWDTLVTRAHRGHRLGGLMKIATMRLLDEGRYDTDTITTFNSVLNQPMITVNEALGARVAGAMVAWRTDL